MRGNECLLVNLFRVYSAALFRVLLINRETIVLIRELKPQITHFFALKCFSVSFFIFLLKILGLENKTTSKLDDEKVTGFGQ